MTQLLSVVQYLDSLLQPASFQDSALNGLQVDGGSADGRNAEVRTIAFAVDAGLSVIEKAVSEQANLLVVHHGLFWGDELPITGIHGKKIELLLRGRCSLYASHLPLDGHREVGNGFELSRFFELEQIEAFCELNGAFIGAKARCDRPRPLEYFIERAAQMTGAIKPFVLPFGKDKIATVGVVTGSGSFALGTCAQEKLDLFISGEAKHEVYHRAKELKMNAIFAGHYATETFGPLALKKRVERDFDVTTVFIDEPTGI